MSKLTALGWCDFFADQLDSSDKKHFQPVRVIRQQRNRYRVLNDKGDEIEAEVSGRFQFLSVGPADFPCVGDFVLVRRGGDEFAVIERVLARRTLLRRREAGGMGEQLIAANVDTVFIVSSLNSELNHRRLERYLSVVTVAGSTPVFVLSKADEADDGDALAADVRRIFPNVATIALSAVKGVGLAALQPYFGCGRTIAFVGSSGVGKSTLLNVLAGEDIQTVNAIREIDSKGRHTTTTRSLYTLRDGTLAIDTPGMRELGLWDGGDAIGSTFADVLSLAERCRFSNCEHETEPECAVKRAISDGVLEEGRLRGFRKHLREKRWFEQQSDKRLALNSKRRWKKINKSMRRSKKI